MPALALVQRQVPNQALPIILIRDEPRLLHPRPGILFEELIRERHRLAAHAILPTLLVEIFVVEELAPPRDHGDPEARPRRRGQDAALQRLDRGAQLLELLPARVEGRFQAVLRLLRRGFAGLAPAGQGLERGGFFVDFLLAGVEFGLEAVELGFEGRDLGFGLLRDFQVACFS